MISDTLQKAKEVILNQGWYQGSFEENLPTIGPVLPMGGKVCILGALSVAQEERFYSLNFKIADFLVQIITNNTKYDYMRHGGSVAMWNDDPTRTEQEVLDLLDEATIAAKEQGI